MKTHSVCSLIFVPMCTTGEDTSTAESCKGGTQSEEVLEGMGGESHLQDNLK